MKRCVFLFVPLLLLLTACARPADQPHATVEYSYVEDLTTLEDVLRCSTNIVRAKLVSMDDFDGAVQVYLFHVTNDLTGNTPDEIHVYDAYDPAYILGHSYYLFLCSGESALYPHTIYTTVVKELILDADAPEAVTAAGSHGMAVPPSDLPRAVADAKTRGLLGDKTDPPVFLSTSGSIREVAAQADVVALIRVRDEQNANPYASLYAAETLSTLKGSADAVPACLTLPPDLTSGGTYYIFLQNTNGACTLFSRAFPAVAADTVTPAALGLS